MISYTQIADGDSVSDSATSFYETPSETKTVITRAHVFNYSASTISLIVYIGGEVANNTVAFTNENLPVGVTSLTTLNGHVMASGDNLYCVAGSAPALSVRITGIQIT